MGKRRRSPGLKSSSARPLRPGVIGVLRRGDAVLMIRRAAHLRGGGNWCFPGGHVEPGESGAEAIVREMREELGLVVLVVDRLGVVKLSDAGYELEVWLLEARGGELSPHPNEVAECRWVDGRDARRLSPAMPSNEAVFAMIGL